MSLAVLSLAAWMWMLQAPATPPPPDSSGTAVFDARSISAASSTVVGGGHDAAEGAFATQHRPEWPPPGDRLVFRPHADVPVTVAAVAVWIAAEAEKTHLVAVACKWCDRTPAGIDTLNGFDGWGRRALKWDDAGRAITLSNVTAFVLAPAAAYGLQWRVADRGERQTDLPANWTLITQSMAIAADVTETMKFAVGRQRPFVHALAPAALATTPASADNNTAFPSGHTTLAFSLAMSSWEIARMRNYGRANWLLVAGLPIATLTAYFRVAADRHYLTDVLTAAAVGSGVGFGIPYVAHRRKADRRVPAVRVVPAVGGEMVAALWEW